jgi:hypothetical protein
VQVYWYTESPSRLRLFSLVWGPDSTHPPILINATSGIISIIHHCTVYCGRDNTEFVAPNFQTSQTWPSSQYGASPASFFFSL